MIKPNELIVLYTIIIALSLIIVFLIIRINKQKKVDMKLKESDQKLKESYDFFRSLLNAIPTPIFYKNTNRKYEECNTAFEEFIGLSRNDIMGKTVFEINQNELASIYEINDIELMNNKGKQFYESQVICSDGKKHDVIFNKASLLSDDNKSLGIVGSVIDITKRKRNENKVIRLSKLKDAMIEINQSIIGVNDITELYNLILQKALDVMDSAMYGSVLILSEHNILKAAAYKGYDEEKIKSFSIPLELSFHYLKSGGDISKTVIINDVDTAYKDECFEASVDINEWRIKSSISTPITINNKLYGLLNIDSNKNNAFNEDDIDIMNYMKNQIESALKIHNLYKEIIYLSKYDKLTNIYNRRSFEDIFDKILNKALRYNESFYLVTFDLNNLKHINDTFGHLNGDEFIKSFVNKLKKSIRNSDVLARYGGDEFVGVFFNTEADALSNKFNQLNADFVNNPVQVNGKDVVYSFSYGIAHFPSDAANYSQLIKISDERMYAYKEKFKKRF